MKVVMVIVLILTASVALGWWFHHLIAFSSQEGVLAAISESTIEPRVDQLVQTERKLAQFNQQPSENQEEHFKGESIMMRESRTPHIFGYHFPIITGSEKILEATKSHVNLSSPKFSPQSKKIVFASGEKGIHNIWLIDSSGDNLNQLTQSSYDEIDPSWMTDGIRIIYSSNETGIYELWIINADGTGKKQITSDGEYNKFHPRCSPIMWGNYRWGKKKGYTILYRAEKDNRSGIWLVGEDGLLPTLVTNQQSNGENYFDPEWSPHGLTIVYTCETDGQTRLCEGWETSESMKQIHRETVLRRGFHLLPAEAGACYPQFLPNFTKLTYRNPDKDSRALWYTSIDGSDARELRLPREIKGGSDWSPDGTSFAYVTTIDGIECIVNQEMVYPLRDVTYLWLYRDLTETQVESLETNHFIVTGKEHNLFHALYESYFNYYMYGGYATPLFITVDSTLELFHLLFDYTLRTIEQNKFFPFLDEMAGGCKKELLNLLKQPGISAEMKNDISLLANYFTVAENLLTPFQNTAKDSLPPVVLEELTLIEKHGTRTLSPLLDQQMDYTQFTVRGHYTLNERLGRYFRTMMWLGQVMFRPITRENPQKAREETRRALILTHVLVNNPDLFDTWKSLYSPMLLFAGGVDDLTVLDYERLMDKVFTEDISVNDLYDERKIEQFISLVTQEKPPRINPQAGMSFRFMPQRFTPDSYIHQELVYPEVGTLSEPRLLPRGLDIMAVLGSERAYELLDRILGETRFKNYYTRIHRLKAEFEQVSEEEWWQNIYRGWLYTLTGLLPEFDEKYPPFMRTTAWQDKSLSTALASWTELRHDTVLYAKQGAAEAGEGGEGWEPIRPKPKGYVEPNPEFFRRLEKLITLCHEGLRGEYMMSAELSGRIEKFKGIVNRLGIIAEKELNNESISDDDYTFIGWYGQQIEYLTVILRESLQSLHSGEVSLVADVFTDNVNNRYLHEAVGKVREMDVIVEIEGKKQINKGGVFTYYEFPITGKRLNDEEWRALLKEGKAPELPVWTNSFIVEK